MWSALCNDDLISICVYDQIRVMCDDDDLTSQSCSLESLHQILVDGLWVKVLLGLVDIRRVVSVAIAWSRFCHARLRPGLLLIAACAVRQTAHQEPVRRSFRLSLHPPIEPIHHFLLSRHRTLAGA